MDPKHSIIKVLHCICIPYHILFSLLFKDKSPLEDGNTQHTGCTFCDPIFKNLVEKHHAIMRHRSAGRGRGGPRGRGRGRPRGRGRGKPKDKMSQLAAYFV